MSQNITLEVNPRSVIEAMDDERLARFIVEVTTQYHTRTASKIGYGHLVVGEMTVAMNTLFAAIDNTQKAGRT